MFHRIPNSQTKSTGQYRGASAASNRISMAAAQPSTCPDSLRGHNLGIIYPFPEKYGHIESIGQKET